jgi:hypothetical protein
MLLHSRYKMHARIRFVLHHFVHTHMNMHRHTYTNLASSDAFLASSSTSGLTRRMYASPTSIPRGQSAGSSSTFWSVNVSSHFMSFFGLYIHMLWFECPRIKQQWSRRMHSTSWQSIMRISGHVLVDQETSALFCSCASDTPRGKQWPDSNCAPSFFFF